MSIPAPPTDSLYKFIAVGGMLAILLAEYLTSSTRIATRELKSQTQNEFVRHGENLVWRLAEIAQKDHLEKEERSRELQIMQLKLDQRIQADHEHLRRRLHEIDSETETWIVRLWVLEIVGWIMMPLGFCLWGGKIQRYQDQILRREAQAIDEQPQKSRNNRWPTRFKDVTSN